MLEQLRADRDRIAALQRQLKRGRETNGSAEHAEQDEHPRHVYHLCVARVPDRDEFRRRLPFDTGVHYPRALTQQPAYERFVRSACPEAERWAAECVSFPCFPEMTDDEIEAVCRAIR